MSWYAGEGTLTDDVGEVEEFYERPKTNEEALQIAIARWIQFQYRVWQQEGNKPRIDWLRISSTGLRVVIILLAGSVTAMTDMEDIPRTVLTVTSAILTILTGIEGYLKLSDASISAQNRRTEILAEYDRQGYEWMIKVHLETDTDKALEEAKRMLETGPKAINDIIAKYISRGAGDEPTKPK